MKAVAVLQKNRFILGEGFFIVFVYNPPLNECAS